ncbi:MAG: putative DNA-binding protein [Actinoallomurus sp.]|jgi:hypothetical protein|nr:putative DNA-binding protein [Actinoallomurus sp.]
MVGQSLPNTADSNLKLEVSVDGAIATGTWTEQTSPTGYYRGATYCGTLQLLVDPMGRSLYGKWLGFGKRFKINPGDWELEWVDGATTPQAVRRYHNKV